MNKAISIGGSKVGGGNPTYVIAEIGINHNGDLESAKKMIDAAETSNCQAVKFQKRDPDISTPKNQKTVLRETPWGLMSYLDYKKKIEFGEDQYDEISRHSSQKGLDWFASPWDIPSVEFLEARNPPAYKIASACITDLDLLLEIASAGKPIIMSTGMSTIEEIDKAVNTVGTENLVLMHSTSSYPMAANEANLLMIHTLKERYEVPVGYSGHETGLQISIAAVALGACAIERHITLDRAMWGTDQSASLEPHGLSKLVRDIRVVEQALGDGRKRVYNSEQASLAKLRRV